MGVFEIEGQDYWSAPFKASSKVLRAHVPTRQLGVFIDAPQDVDLSTHARVPLLVLWCETERVSSVIDPFTMGQLICVRLEDRRVECCPLLEIPDSAGLFEDAPETVPPTDSPRGLMEQTDASQLELLRESGTCLLTAVVFDRVSNRIQVRAHRTPSGYQDAAVQTFIDLHRRRPPPPELVDGPLEPFFQTPQSPNLTKENEGAIAIEVERVVLHERSAKAILHGAVRLPVRQREVVPPLGIEDTIDGRPRPTAILSVHLLIMNSTGAEPQLLHLRVPCFSEEPLALGEHATGYFQYDLFEHPAIAGKAQTNVIYVFAGEVMSGPHPMAVVTEEMLEMYD